MATSNEIIFGRETLEFLESREYLVTNGIGGFASGTLAGIHTRRYHGLLVAALKPPLQRTLLGVKLDETVLYDGKEYFLFANCWKSHAISPEGYNSIESFQLDGTIPVWRFTCGDALLEKRIWMEPGSNTTYVFFRLERAFCPLNLKLKAFINYRSFHNTTHAGNWHFNIASVPPGIQVESYQGATPFFVFSDKGSVQIENEWYHDYFLAKEAERGLDCLEDHLHAATFEAELQEGESLTVVFTTEKEAHLDGLESLLRRKKHETDLLNKREFPPSMKQFLLAADAFIVVRPLPGAIVGKTIIAGYHWFGDWGRDTMICLPGLTLTTGRPEIARLILQTFAHYVDQGMLPNRFPDAGEKPEYNTVDATLWYFEAIRAYYVETRDQKLVEELFPVLAEIIDWHNRGTRYQIHVDPEDGLLYAGEKGVQLTWMDAKIGDFVVTPRTGKPVEINALWLNGLKTMREFAQLLNRPTSVFDALLEKGLTGFKRFWNEETQFCFDVLDTPDGNDATLRPNQIFAVSLELRLLTEEQEKKVVEICGRKLLTSHGLRSLDPSDSRYRGHYGGTPFERDSVYHQGTVWPWLLGAYSLAYLKVFKNPTAALELLTPMMLHLTEAGIGTCSEIFDGDPPFAPKGCIAQGWSVAEILRASDRIRRALLK